MSRTGLSSDYGTTGLIDIPSARMQADGTLTATTAFDKRHQQYAFTYQATPWFETTFRYTGFEKFFHWDRNYEAKVRLWQETEWLPQVAVGIRDLLGTGVFSGEYVVGSKQWGPLDVTLGVGWGRLAGNGMFTNPLTYVDERFETRDEYSGEGGEFSFGQFFAGPEVGIFGGASYQLPWLPVSLMAEYNPDQYDFDVSNGEEPPRSPWSYGFNWLVAPGVSLAVSHQNGEYLGFSVQASLDTTADPPLRAPPPFISSRYLAEEDLPEQLRRGDWYDRMLYDAERSGLYLIAAKISPGGSQAELVVGNENFPLWSDAVEYLIALADVHLPPRVRTVHLVIEEAGHRTATLTAPLPSRALSRNPREQVRQRKITAGRYVSDPQRATSFVTNKLDFSANIDNRLQLFDPDDPARYQFYLDLGANYRLANHLVLRASYGINIYNNFDESLRQESDSQLPKVRSDIVKYLNEGETGIDELMLDSRNTYGSNLHYRVFGGILEEMFSGTGGEVLYWPTGSRVALGLSLAYAKQRDFDKRFDHLNYGVTTGFVSAYWETPFYQYDVAVHAGQYLAKDVGATLEVRRTFSNGWQIGVWATRTDVSSEEFGEGSFDKGFYFKIPLNTLLNSNTRSAISTRIRPIQRDGGQRLENHSATLFWDLRESSYRDLNHRRGQP